MSNSLTGPGITLLTLPEPPSVNNVPPFNAPVTTCMFCITVGIKCDNNTKCPYHDYYQKLFEG